MKTYCVYLLYCVATGGVYVGYTYNFKQRWQQHKKAAKKSDKPLYRDMLKYSHTNFVSKIVEENILDVNQAFSAERKWIKFLREENYLVYNISAGGAGAVGCTMSEDNRQKMSERMSGENNYFFGMSLSGEANGHYGHKILPHVQEILLKCRTKYTDQQIQEIKIIYATEQYTLKQIGEKFNINPAYIHKIVFNKIRNGANNIKGPLIKPRITPDNVREIRLLHKSGQYTIKGLGIKFNLSRAQITRIIKYERWKHIE